MFHGEISPYSNFHTSPFETDGQRYSCSEHWIQYSKAMLFGDAFTANKILQADTPYEMNKLSYQINEVDKERWKEEGYAVCLKGITAKFHQNPNLLSMFHTTSPKLIAEASQDQMWGTGVGLRDTNALNKSRWSGNRWLSNILMEMKLY